MVDSNTFQGKNEDNTNVTSPLFLEGPSIWRMQDVIPNPKCVRNFFETLKLKGVNLSEYAKSKSVNRSKLSQILHGLNVPRTPSKRRFWAEEVLGFDVQLFWVLNESKENCSGGKDDRD